MRPRQFPSRPRTRLIVIGTAIGVVVAMSGTFAANSVAAPGEPAGASVFREKVAGIFAGYPGDCPDELPATPLVCHEWDITVYRNGSNDEPGGLAPSRSRWVLLALRHTLTFPGGEGEPTESDVGFGFRDGVDVSFDAAHLEYAIVRAPDLALTDGTTVDLEATWTPTSGRQLYGNDGPALDQYGLVHHFHDSCVTLNSEGHQKVRSARVDAVVNGTSSSYTGAYAYLAVNQFTVVEVHPKSCG